MQVSDFDFDLPEGNIALRPVEPRDHARLLHISKTGTRADQHVYDLPNMLNKGDLLIVNNTRVLPVRLTGIRYRSQSQAKVELTLIKRHAATEWTALARPAKRLSQGDIISFGAFEAEIKHRTGGEVSVCFHVEADQMDRLLEETGDMPLPPYIASRRRADGRDKQDYQTMFAHKDGAVAAPTAGLHFTDGLIANLKGRGIDLAEVTLHVGAGTFLPVSVEDIKTHKMHFEWGEVGADTVEKIYATHQQGGRVIAIGTTSLRIIESAALSGQLEPFSGETDIFIYPGYEFRVIDGLITNFHLPRSTLFMLVCAFSGTQIMQHAYDHAISAGYRFYSYGDACLLER